VLIAQNASVGEDQSLTRRPATSSKLAYHCNNSLAKEILVFLIHILSSLHDTYVRGVVVSCTTERGQPSEESYRLAGTVERKSEMAAG
jgi:energy-converting hydrogenase Eha subunit B